MMSRQLLAENEHVAAIAQDFGGDSVFVTFNSLATTICDRALEEGLGDINDHQGRTGFRDPRLTAFSKPSGVRSKVAR